MSIKPSSLLKLSVAGAVILSLGACKGSDKEAGALKSKSVTALNLSKSEASVFSKYFQTEPCSIDEQEALGALAGLGMGESGDNDLNFGSREYKNGVVTYGDVKLGDQDNSFSAGKVSFHCPQMGDEAPNFSRVDISDITFRDNSGNMELTADSFNIAKPSVNVARDIVGMMTDPGSIGGDDFRVGAFSFTNMAIKSDEINGTMGGISWGIRRDEGGQGLADLTIDKMNIVSDLIGTEFNLDFAGMSTRNLNLGIQTESTAHMSPEEAMESLFQNISTVTGKPYDELIIDKLTLDTNSALFNFGGLEAQTKEKGKVITTRQNIKQSVIELKPAMAENPSLFQAYSMLQSLDMDKIGFSGSSVSKINPEKDTVSVSDGLFVIDDVMNWNFEYEADGLASMMDSLNSAQLSGSEADLLEAYGALKLRGFRMTIEDDSIVEKGMTLATQITGQSEAQIKLMLTGASFLAESAAQNELQADVYSKTAIAFAEFVKEGGSLTIKMNPPKPFALAPFFTGEADNIDPASLGFSASHGK